MEHVVEYVSKPKVHLCIPTVSVGENEEIYSQVLNHSLKELYLYNGGVRKSRGFLDPQQNRKLSEGRESQHSCVPPRSMMPGKERRYLINI